MKNITFVVDNNLERIGKFHENASSKLMETFLDGVYKTPRQRGKSNLTSVEY